MRKRAKIAPAAKTVNERTQTRNESHMQELVVNTSLAINASGGLFDAQNTDMPQQEPQEVATNDQQSRSYSPQPPKSPHSPMYSGSYNSTRLVCLLSMF